MVDNARRIAAAVDLPVIADADTGYGNAINVVRTVQAYEQAGVAGIHLEDQVMPKKCGHMIGKAVITADEMVGKIRAAVAARRDPEFLLIARTDAAAVEGLSAALDRARAYAAAGADVLFVEAPTSEDDIERVATELRGVAPLVFNWAEGGRTPPIRWPASPSWASRWCCSRSARCWRPRRASVTCSPPCAPTVCRRPRCPTCRPSTASPT
jgi:2,3-dimethylmalate lyase